MYILVAVKIEFNNEKPTISNETFYEETNEKATERYIELTNKGNVVRCFDTESRSNIYWRFHR